jgi:hypothetical protein
MRNCKDEFIREIANRDVLCAEISHGDDSWRDEDDDAVEKARLIIGHTPEDFENFLKAIDYEYDSGYGGQEVFGYIWYKDGTWSERGEYDGSEWWEYKSCPEIPTTLKKVE